MAPIPVALQLYTVRKQLADDYAGTLRAVKAIGYDMVQLTGNVPNDAQRMREMLDEIGLEVAGIHVPAEELQGNLDHWIDYAKAIGTRDVVFPWTEPHLRRNREDWLGIFALLDRVGARCKERGVRLSYHNHSFEFEHFDGKCILDVLYERIPPDHLYAEIDTYWIKHGGADPVEYILKYAGRQPILHVKDMADDARRSFAEVGSGILDWPAIHAAAVQAGVEYYAVEQDVCPGDPLESARISLEFMNKLLGQ
jgi:sugar phosphate isomerase/epimerase